MLSFVSLKALAELKNFRFSQNPQKTAICLLRTANFDRALWTAPFELDNEPPIIGKLCVSSFRIFERFVDRYFNDEVMPVLVSKGHSARKSLKLSGL